MATQTRSDIASLVQDALGDTSSTFETYLNRELDDAIILLWDSHDWNFKHKVGTFNTVSGTEQYDLLTNITNLRSSQDIELIYDKTNGTVLEKRELNELRRAYPKEDTSGKPQYWAPWGHDSIILSDEPDGAYVVKVLHAAAATLPTADDDDLYDDCGLPRYVQHIIKELVFASGYRYHKDNRYGPTIELVSKILIPNAIKADMRYLETDARFKFYEEHLTSKYPTYDDFLRNVFWSNG